jgi:hypothetical protein
MRMLERHCEDRRYDHYGFLFAMTGLPSAFCWMTTLSFSSAGFDRDE